MIYRRFRTNSNRNSETILKEMKHNFTLTRGELGESRVLVLFVSRDEQRTSEEESLRLLRLLRVLLKHTQSSVTRGAVRKQEHCHVEDARSPWLFQACSELSVQKQRSVQRRRQISCTSLCGGSGHTSWCGEFGPHQLVCWI